MLAGTIVMEDMSLHFTRVITEAEGIITMHITVCDNLSGNTETYVCYCEDFAVALGMAMHPECTLPDFDKTLETMAEKAMPKNTSLRWIP